MGKLGLGFFKLRFFMYLAASAFAYNEGNHVIALFLWFIFAQFEYLFWVLNLEDETISEWEKKLKSLIKESKDT